MGSLARMEPGRFRSGFAVAGDGVQGSIKVSLRLGYIRASRAACRLPRLASDGAASRPPASGAIARDNTPGAGGPPGVLLPATVLQDPPPVGRSTRATRGVRIGCLR